MIIRVSQSNKTNNRKKVGFIAETEKCLLFLYWNVTINLYCREEMALGVPTGAFFSQKLHLLSEISPILCVINAVTATLRQLPSNYLNNYLNN